MSPQKIIVIAGTRPEAIKLCPVIYELKAHPKEFRTKVCNAGQHDEMINQVFDDFDIIPDIDLRVMRPGQSLSGLSARLFDAVDVMLRNENPDWVIVQGDTTTTMVASLCCFYGKIKLAHVEAGLRSHDRFAPFPEEINRRVVGLVADLHFAPTHGAKKNLLLEGVREKDIVVTGNTAIDALLWMRERIAGEDSLLPQNLQEALLTSRRFVLITGHRRENFGEGLYEICQAIRELAQSFRDAIFVYPVHPNPNVLQQVKQLLGDVERVFLLEPVSYKRFVYLMDRCDLILTDSGGIQEEAPSLGKPVLVMRGVTERPEGIVVGANKLVGTSRASIVANASSNLSNLDGQKKMLPVRNPFGDGQAAKRIIQALRFSSQPR